MRLLFASTRGAGHIGPLIPFAEVCRRAGHDVLVVAPRSAWQHVARARLPFAGVDDPLEETLAPLWERVRAAADRDEQDRIVLNEIFAGEFARAALPGMLAVMRRWRPDIVVRETLEFASLVAAEALNLPEAHVSCFLTVVDRDAYGLSESLARLREESRLRAYGRSEDGPYLTLAPRALEDPARPPAPDTRRYRVAPAPAAQPLPDWWGGSDAPLVYVSFGSAAAGNGFFPAVYRGAADALADEPIRVLMTLGTEVDPVDLGPVPENVHVERWVPQAAVMPHAAAMVGHGGSGSTLMAMAAGLPLAVVPLFADQPINAARVAALGAGLSLDGVESLATAVRSLLAVPSYRDAAAAVAAEIAAHSPIETVVPLLRSIARGDALAA
ncbi:MAG TPA: glycosyltransferase [Solirubrobacter sp.]|nr:glycosyltransferase [Solirubrobacter sp.]